MTWEAKRNKLDELIKKALAEEPCLDLPVIEQKIGIDAQYDMLDSLIYDALLEEDFSPLPVVDPKIVQWIDRLEEFEEKQLKLTSDAYGQQQPEREEETTVQAVKENKGKQKQFQPQKCNMCNKEFQFPVNMRRHKWRHRHKTEEKILESSRDQFREYWEELEDEKARQIICIKDAVLPANLTELQCNDIIDAVSSYVEGLDDESRRLQYNLLITFLLKPDGANKCLPFQEILDALCFLSDDTFFRGTSKLEMQQIVFPHAISMAEIEEQGLIASFGFLVEYCMMKAWADDRKRLADLLEQEEEEAKKQMQLTASTSKAKKSKPSSSKRKKEKARKQEEFELSKKHTNDKEEQDMLKDKENDSLSQLNQRDSQERDKNMADKSSDIYSEQGSSIASATQSNLVATIDVSVQIAPFSSPSQEKGASQNEKDTTDQPSEYDEEHASSDAGDTQLNLVSTSVDSVRDNMSSSPNQEKATETVKEMMSVDLRDDGIYNLEPPNLTDAGGALQDKEEHDNSSQWNQRDSKESEEKLADKSSQHHKEQVSSNAAATQLIPLPSDGSLMQDNILSYQQSYEETSKSLKGIMWGDLTDDDINYFTKKSEEGQGKLDSTEQLVGGQHEREIAKAGRASRNQQQYGKIVRGRGHYSRQTRTQGHGRRGRSYDTYGKPMEWIQTRKKTKAPAAQRYPFFRKKKEPAENKDSTICKNVLIDGRNFKMLTRSVLDEGRYSKASGELEGTKTTATTSGWPVEETKRLNNATEIARFMQQRWDDANADPESEYYRFPDFP